MMASDHHHGDKKVTVSQEGHTSWGKFRALVNGEEMLLPPVVL